MHNRYNKYAIQICQEDSIIGNNNVKIRFVILLKYDFVILNVRTWLIDAGSRISLIKYFSWFLLFLRNEIT